MIRRFSALQVACAVVLGLSLPGCTVMRGAPDSFIEESLYEGRESVLHVSREDIDLLLMTDQSDVRMSVIDKITASIDARYLDFRHSLVANRKHFAASTGLLGTLSNIASTLTESKGVKTNYAQLGILVSGVRTQIDSTYLFDQTVLAIVSQMDADRAKQFRVLLEFRNKKANEVSGVTVLQQLMAYYHAGTVLSAITEISKTSATTARTEEEKTAREMKTRLNIPK